MSTRQVGRRTSISLALIALWISSCSTSTDPTNDSPAPAVPEGARVWDFEDGRPGEVPPGFVSDLTGGGGPVKWQVVDVGDAPSGSKVVAQLSDDRTNADVDVSVSFKTISGEVDASGGLVFRYQDKGNFYVVRANSLERNVVAYKTEDGARSNIGVRGKGDAHGVKADVPHRQWNTLRVIAKGKLIDVFLNDRKLFDVEDETLRGPGRVGLWTKADAVTQFDALTVKSLDG